MKLDLFKLIGIIIFVLAIIWFVVVIFIGHGHLST